MGDRGFADLLGDLRDEQVTLDELLAAHTGTWSLPTPAEGWTIADTIRHLVVAERAATTSVRDDRDFVGASPAPGARDAVDDHDLLEAWRVARTATLEAMAARAGGDRVPWGGRRMSVHALATARLMETWAHGLDCAAALGVQPIDTDRLVHVAWLGHRTLPFAFARRGIEPPAPPAQLRLELVRPEGAPWSIGPASSRAVIHGPLAAWCRVVTRRVRADETALVAEGALARAALDVAQAYLDG